MILKKIDKIIFKKNIVIIEYKLKSIIRLQKNVYVVIIMIFILLNFLHP